MTYQPKVTKPADTVVKQGGCAVLAFALEGGGKTHFLVNSHDVAPHLVLLNFDRDASHHLKRYKGEDYIEEKFEQTDNPVQARAACNRVEQIIGWATQQKHPIVFGIDNVVNWKALANTAYLPNEAELSKRRNPEIVARDYELSNTHLRRCVFSLESSNLYAVLTSPAEPRWVGETRKAQEGGEDLIESKAWKGFDFCITSKIYLFNAGGTSTLVRPIPQEKVGKPEYKAQIITAKFRSAAQGMILESPTLKEVLGVVG